MSPASEAEAPIPQQSIEDLAQYVGVPKALLPGPDGVQLINNWWTLIQKARTLFSDVCSMMQRRKEASWTV